MQESRLIYLFLKTYEQLQSLHLYLAYLIYIYGSLGDIQRARWQLWQISLTDFNSIDLTARYETLMSFIASKYTDDIAIGSTLTILGEYDYGEILSAYENAKAHEKEKNHNITICTAHSSKGLEWDKVVLLEDMNKSIRKIIDKKEPDMYDANDIESFNIYYVACSRSIKELHNAIMLDKHLDDSL